MVELIVGMAVTSILLVGLTGVLFSASSAYNGWIDRVETSGTGDVLAAALIADSHRYLTCSTTTTSRLDFCLPGSDVCPPTTTGRLAPCVPSPMVSYQSLPGAPYTVMRSVQPSSSRVMVRDLPAPIVFRVSCGKAGSGNVDLGFISVQGLPGRSDLRVYFQAASGECKNA